MVFLTSISARADTFDPFEQALFRPADRTSAIISMRFVADEQELKRECAHIGVFSVSAAIGYCHHWVPRELTDSCQVVTISGLDALSNVMWGMVRCTSESLESRWPDGRDRDIAMVNAQSALQLEPDYDRRAQFSQSLFRHGWVTLQPLEQPDVVERCRSKWPNESWPDGLAVCATWHRKNKNETCNVDIINKTVGNTSPLSVTMTAMRGCNGTRDSQP